MSNPSYKLICLGHDPELMSEYLVCTDTQEETIKLLREMYADRETLLRINKIHQPDWDYPQRSVMAFFTQHPNCRLAVEDTFSTRFYLVAEDEERCGYLYSPLIVCGRPRDDESWIHTAENVVGYHPFRPMVHPMSVQE